MRKVLLAAALAAACAPPETERGTSVLLVTVDTLRADHLGCYGYGRDTSPNLDALAERSLLFERAYSHAPFTAPSHASLLTGLFPNEHGVVFWGWELSERAPTMGRLFGDAGWRTGAFHNHPGLRPSELTRGFDEVQVRWFEPWEATVEGFFAWLDEGEGPFAAWVHVWDVHRPYGWRDWRSEIVRDHVDRDAMTLAFAETRFGTPTDVTVGRGEQYYNLNAERRSRSFSIAGEERRLGEADLESIADRYDGGVWFADRGIGALVRGLEERGLFEDLLLVLTSDHGESLLERDACYFTHDPFLYEETLHVPLLVHLPGGARAGERVGALALGVDVLPTMLGAAGLEAPAGLSGARLDRLASLDEGGAGGEGGEPRVLFAQTQSNNAKETGERLGPDARADPDRWLEWRVAVSDGRHKLVHDRGAGTWALYDLEADPGETRDLSGDPASADVLARMRTLYETLRSRGEVGGRGATSEELLRVLEEMGYAEGQPPAGEPSDPEGT